MAKDNTPARENLLSARSLRYLHEIDLHGGLRAAADALAINGSVISRQVAQLERDHGVALLERRGRRAVLTEIGLSLVEQFRESSRRDADMPAQLEDFRSLRRGRLGIGVGEGFVENLLAKRRGSKVLAGMHGQRLSKHHIGPASRRQLLRHVAQEY